MTKALNPTARYDLIDLRVFIAVAEEGNVSRGAARCHLAPSTASLRLKGLEAAIGVRLLQRQARGVSLLPAGRVLLDHARRCVAQLEQMHADLLPFAQGLTSHLTLFANNNAISTHLPDDLSRYFATHPSVRITMKERLSADIVAAVASGEADIGVVAMEEMEAPHPALDYSPYRIDQLVLLAPPGSALAKLPTVAFADCLQQPFISLQQGAALHTFLMNKAAAKGVRPNVRVQVSDYRAIARLVSSGAGFGIVPLSALDATDKEKVDVLHLTDPWAKRKLYVCLRRQNSDANPFLVGLVATLSPDAGRQGAEV